MKFFAFFFGLIFISVFSFSSLVCGKENALELQRLKEEMQRQHETKEKALELAEAVSAEVKEIRREIIKKARDVQEYESSLNELDNEMYELEKEQTAIKSKLDAKNKQLQSILASLEIVAQRPTEVLFVAPMSPEDTLRSALMLKALVPSIETACKELRQELVLLASVKAAIRSKSSQIKMAYVGLDEKSKQLRELVGQKKQMQKRLVNESIKADKRAKQLANQAKDMAELIAKLDARRKQKELERKKAEASLLKTARIYTEDTDLLSVRDFEKAKGKMPFPVKGKITERYGDLTSAGLHAKGLTLQTRQGAQVISPNDGVVLFAGSFKGYGNLLIIEHAEGYHTLLSGMDKMDAYEGQSLLAGEPVGTMERKGSPNLYVEMRKNGQPINPLRWLAYKS